MPQTYTLEFEITEDCVDGATDAVLTSDASWLTWSDVLRITTLLGLLAVVSCGFVVSGVFAGERRWWFYLVAVSVWVISGLLLLLVWSARLLQPSRRRRVREQVLQSFREHESKRIRWTFDEERITVQSGDNASREIRWNDVIALNLTRHFWIMVVRDGRSMLIPGDQIPELTAGFILFRAREAGAVIRIPEEMRTDMHLPVEGDYKEPDERSS